MQSSQKWQQCKRHEYNQTLHAPLTLPSMIGSYFNKRYKTLMILYCRVRWYITLLRSKYCVSKYCVCVCVCVIHKQRTHCTLDIVSIKFLLFYIITWDSVVYTVHIIFISIPYCAALRFKPRFSCPYLVVVYTVACTYSLCFTTYNVHCTVYNAQCINTLCIVKDKLWILLFRISDRRVIFYQTYAKSILKLLIC